MRQPDVNAKRTCAASSEPNISRLVAYLLPCLAFVSLWFLEHPYAGIVHDSRIYIGNSLASFGRQEIAQDFMFAFDGQFQFTIFPQIFQLAKSVFGHSTGAMVISATGLLVWIAALWMLIGAITTGRSRFVLLIFVSMLPSGYSSFGVLTFSEAFATPRCLAEALVLIALTLSVKGRSVLSGAFVVFAGLLHPITALPAAVILFFMFVSDHERTPASRIATAIAAGVCGTIGLGLAALDAPIFGRLFQAVDASWMDILRARSTHLFLSLWDPHDMAKAIVQFCILLIGLTQISGSSRRLFACVSGVVAISLVTSLIFGEWLSSLLIVQVQLWRATWLLTLFSTLALAICCARLWPQDNRMKLVLAFVVIAWCSVFINEAVGIISGLGALMLLHMFSRSPIKIGSRRASCTGYLLLSIGVYLCCNADCLVSNHSVRIGGHKIASSNDLRGKGVCNSCVHCLGPLAAYAKAVDSKVRICLGNGGACCCKCLSLGRPK